MAHEAISLGCFCASICSQVCCDILSAAVRSRGLLSRVRPVVAHHQRHNVLQKRAPCPPYAFRTLLPSYQCRIDLLEQDLRTFARNCLNVSYRIVLSLSYVRALCLETPDHVTQLFLLIITCLILFSSSGTNEIARSEYYR